MDRETLDKWLERGILGVVLAILVFAPLAFGAVRGMPFAVVQGLTFLAGFVWLIRLWVSPERRLFWPPICWAVLLFLIYAVFQYMRSDVEYTARQELIKVVIYSLIFFIVVNNFQQQKLVVFVVISLIVVAAGIATYAVYQYASGSQTIWYVVKPIGYATRGGGTFVNPNHLAGFLAMILPIGFALVILGRLNHVAKVFLAYACLIMVAGIFVTLSRGGWLATGIMITCFFLFLVLRRGAALPAVAILLLVVGIAAGLYSHSYRSQTRIERTFNREGKVEDVRFYLWQATIGLWKKHPVTGVGPGHFDHRYPEQRPADWRTQQRPIYVHNDYLNTLVDWGVIGGGLIAAAIVLLGVGIFKTRRAIERGENELGSKKSNREAVLFGASMGLLALLLHSVVEFNMQVPANAILAITLMALITSFRRYEPQRFGHELPWFPRTVFSLLIAAALVFLAKQSTQKAGESIWMARARKLAPASPERLAALKNAHESEPGNYETTYLIGELLRKNSWEGNANYREQAEEAMQWFGKGIRLNRYSPYNFLRYGMCLDWIGEHEKAQGYFEKALELDPNSYFTAAHMGWHYLQFEDYSNAKKWFERSLEILNNWNNRNQMPVTYLELINRRLTETSEEPVFNIPPPQP